MSQPPKITGLKRLLNAAHYSVEGLKTTFIDETAFRQELMACLILIPLALWIAPDNMSPTLMLGSLMMVLVVELINSAIEAVVDLHSTAVHPLAKKAKDAGSAAVLMMIGITTLCWVLIFIR
ncbi:MAG: diacylglycerol kinase [Pseudomonadota bacterium]